MFTSHVLSRPSSFDNPLPLTLHGQGILFEPVSDKVGRSQLSSKAENLVVVCDSTYSQAESCGEATEADFQLPECSDYLDGVKSSTQLLRSSLHQHVKDRINGMA